MTGFGRGEAAEGTVRYEVELRGVNHRFLEIRVRMPSETADLEAEIRTRVAGSVRRGRIDLVINRTQFLEPEATVAISREIVSKYLEAASAIASEFRLSKDLSLEAVLALPGAVRIEYRRGAGQDQDGEKKVLLDAVEAALAAYEECRTAEGGRLARDLEIRLETMEADLEEIDRQAASTAEEYSRKLRRRLEALLEGIPLDEGRLMQEAAYLATRTDVTEEVVRLRAHLKQVRDYLAAGDGPVGKALDFLVQEMNREANTIGSKAEGLAIGQAVLRIKGEVEKVREQVQNIE